MKQTSSLFVGRWQPFHAGHKALIETVLKKGKPVVIAIRDTDISQKNPYTVQERWGMLQRAFQKYGDLVKIVVIPDIDEICYGRDVGYDIREIKASKEMRAISGTKARAADPPLHPIIWLTGQSEAGKTTLAQMLKKKMSITVLDGDEMRETISLGAGFTPKDREEHNLRVARLAAVLAKQTPVVVAVIAPFAKTRRKINAMLRPVWVYVKRGKQKNGTKYPYETPSRPHVIADSDKYSPEENAEIVLSYLRSKKP